MEAAKANLSKKMRRMKPLQHKSKRFKEVISPSFFVTLKQVHTK
jgi:hypothetical protein